MTLVRNEDILGDGLSRQPDVVDDDPTLEGVLTGLTGSVQEVEDVVYDTAVQRILSDAQGAQLDQWGDLLEERREGLTDVAFRRILRAKLLSNRSHGTIEFLLEIMVLATDAADIRLRPLYPGGVRIEYVVPASLGVSERSRIVSLVSRAASGGVSVDVIEAVPGYFGFDGNPDALGFGQGQFATRTDDNG